MNNIKIELVPYNEFWEKVFEKESQNISKLLRNNLIECHHIGATAIKSIQARPTLDMIAIVHTLDGILAFKKEFSNAGFFLDDKKSSLTNYFFTRPAQEERGSDLTHVNILEQTNPAIYDYLDFRDYLNSEKEIAHEYQKLRKKLIHDDKKYQELKTIFITTTLNSLKNAPL